MKPRYRHLNEVLCSKRGGKHEPKVGPKAKRAKQKAEARREKDTEIPV